MSTKPNVSVVVQRDESIERALKRFKRLCEHAGIRKAVRAKSYYEKPSEARRREMRKAIRNRRRAEKKAQERAARKLDRGRNRRRGGPGGGEGGEGGGGEGARSEG
jgi:small subunit ribosomal protein S21